MICTFSVKVFLCQKSSNQTKGRGRRNTVFFRAARQRGDGECLAEGEGSAGISFHALSF